MHSHSPVRRQQNFREILQRTGHWERKQSVKFLGAICIGGGSGRARIGSGAVPPVGSRGKALDEGLEALPQKLTALFMKICYTVTVFGRPFVKRFALCYRTVVCPAVLSCL